MYKLIVTDLDGTLLNSYGEVSSKTKEIIKKLKENNVETIIASGRPISSIKAIAEEIESENYFIAGNGSTIYDIKNNEIIYEKNISKQKTLEIIDICEENSIHYNIYTEDEIIANKLQYNVLFYFKENQKKIDEKKVKITIVDDIREYVKQIENKKIIKITICDRDKMIFNAIIKKIKNIKEISILDVSHMSRKMIKQGTEEIPIEYYYTEISLAEVNKWTAILYLIQKLNIKKEDVIAVGDNMNDKEMIENAGMGIAMKGSTPFIVEVADIITKNTNNEDGVANVLKEIFNIKA